MLSHRIRFLLKPAGAAIERLPHWVFSRIGQFVLDIGLAVAAVFIAFALRFDASIPRTVWPVVWLLVLVLPVVRAVSLRILGGHRTIWRYFSLDDLLTLVLSALPATMVMATLRYSLAHRVWFAQIPGGFILIEFGTFLLLASAARATRRVMFEAAGKASSTRALVIGTGESLASAVRHMASQSGIKVVGLLAADKSLRGLVIGGYPVIGAIDELSDFLASQAVDLILISDVELDCLGATVEIATRFDVNIRLLPSAEQVSRGAVRVSASVRPERVVGRSAFPAVEPLPEVVEAYRDRRILVTGAGGSIGSELCRQISRLPIASLVLLDQDENSIFEMSGEIGSTLGGRIVPIVGDIRDQYALERIFEKHRPHVVLHAAAYKHVPVMEQNCSEAVLNNVVGTRQVAECAFAWCAERFLMISTDKAVRPQSVMGATKKIAEQVVHLMGNRDGKSPRCSCVRFGNVVGSRGSVVPIFLRQIAAGGPITITDENMTRYFMTIPEAVQLVLQASTLGSAGNIYMLDMGDPIKITDMARKLIEMSGLRPDKDIATRVIGSRPGEKLHEQLFGNDAEVNSTEFERIFSVHVPPVDEGEFLSRLKNLEDAARLRDEGLVRSCLHEMQIGFDQSNVPTKAAWAGE